MTEKPKAVPNLEGERFDAVSAVVGQMAHDFNNLLTPLLAYPPLIKSDIPDGAYGVNLIGVVEKTARDMAHVTRQLLELTTRRKFEQSPLNVNTIVERVLQELKVIPMPAGVAIESDLGSDLPSIRGSADRLASLLQNICVNGIEAIGSAGTLRIETRAAHEERRPVCCGQIPGAGDYVMLRVSDTGGGIPPDVLDRIFEPFVTTRKTAGRRGAGLGLSVVYRIANEHEAGIDVDSTPGQGSVFTLYFPVAGRNAADGGGGVVREQPVAAPASQDGGEVECDKKRILVVDDEKTILKLFQMILSSGLPDRKIDLAGNGREAVDLFMKDHHGALVMDLHMPVLDGYAAFCEIEKLCRARKWKMPAVIFCTGFAPPDTVRGIVSASPIRCLLSKPISGDILVDAVKKRLEP